MQRLLKLGILGIILSGCGTNRPAVNYCEVRGKAIPAYCRCTTPKGKLFNLTIAECDNYLAASKEEMADVFDYVISLEKDAAKCVAK